MARSYDEPRLGVTPAQNRECGENFFVLARVRAARDEYRALRLAELSREFVARGLVPAREQRVDLAVAHHEKFFFFDSDARQPLPVLFVAQEERGEERVRAARERTAQAALHARPRPVRYAAVDEERGDSAIAALGEHVGPELRLSSRKGRGVQRVERAADEEIFVPRVIYMEVV